MCRYVDECSKKEHGGGKLTFCCKEGYDTQLFSTLVKKSVATVRNNAEKYDGKKISNKWYFPPCLLFKYSLNYDTTLPEWLEWMKLSLKCDVEIKAHMYKGLYSKQLSEYLNVVDDDSIMISYKNRIDVVKNKLINTIDLLSLDQAIEIRDFLQKPRAFDRNYFESKEKDYFDLILVLPHSGYFRARYLEKNEPFRCLYFQYRKRYRSGRNWGGTRKATIEKRQHKCELCGASERLNVHHIKGRLNNDDESLQVLCEVCHRKIHYYKNT
ncbi:HNH endonuclease [Desulfitobacterium hafniense]|uniref:HNH nuclease domain-containing protein n=1 Tax=Desulfitobacterium hafniense (strain Y51) TaxID=138119 RepID=Q24ZE8_DESHY|nr:HNH endonuclease signature motif containing protein [Desulfitobacterium hafniense]BAE82594.1 hypothetical protein DSY0805 [Desulfitobacterium hafniense Y51]